MDEQLIKKYRSTFGIAGALKDYEKDAKKLAKKGWRVVSAVPAGNTGFFLKKQGIVLVTYSRPT